MYKLIQLAQNKIALGISAIAIAVVFGLALAPTVLAVDAPVVPPKDTFGLKPIEDNTELGNKGLVKSATDIINVALGLLGIVAVVIVLIGGFKWMTAGGNEENVEAGRKYIVSGIIGLAIILSAFAITKFVIGNLSTATDSGTVQGTF